MNNIAALLGDDEQKWADNEAILPVQENEDVRGEYAVEWAFDDDGAR